ncbi:MAG TPA: hypothetical protein VF185_02750 [Patescibacteria group bacterium]
MNQEETIQIVSGIEGSKFIKDGMFIKETSIPYPARNQKIVDDLRESFRIAQENGEVDYIPLPPVIIFEKNKMKATDMTQGRKNTIIDTHTRVPVNLKNLDEVKAQIEKIGKVAFNAGTKLGMDNYAIVVNPKDSMGRAYVLDVSSLTPIDSHDSLLQIKNSVDAFNDIVESKTQK